MTSRATVLFYRLTLVEKLSCQMATYNQFNSSGAIVVISIQGLSKRQKIKCKPPDPVAYFILPLVSCQFSLVFSDVVTNGQMGKRRF